MPQRSKVIVGKAMLGAVAISLTFGAVQLASGRDLSGSKRISFTRPAATDSAINRAAKGDRISGATASAALTQTISLRINGLSDTSVLVRVPVSGNTENDARSSPAAPSFIKPGDRKMAVACEPSVSVLTEVARHMQPGRCVT